MIKSFRHKGLQKFFETGSKAGIQVAHAGRLRLQLAALDQAIRPEDLSAPSWALHPLKGDLEARLGREVRIANDANCFALSEAIDGAARDAGVVFGVILGTGVGGAIVVDRRVVAALRRARVPGRPPSPPRSRSPTS